MRKIPKKSIKMSSNSQWNETQEFYSSSNTTSTFNITTNLTQTRTTTNLHVATAQIRRHHHTNNLSKDSVIALLVGVTTATLFLGIISTVRKVIRSKGKTNPTSPPASLNPSTVSSDITTTTFGSSKHCVEQRQKQRIRVRETLTRIDSLSSNSNST